MAVARSEWHARRLVDFRNDMAKSFSFDPKLFISPPYVQCPKCGAEEFGVLMIRRNRMARRCRQCWHDATMSLPPLKKRVFYLDQMVISNIAKALDPVWSGTRLRDHTYWLELFDSLDRLLKLQLIVCPHSPTHEKESSVTQYFEILRRLYEHLSLGVEFELPLMVYAAQLHLALDAHFAGGSVTYSELPLDRVLDGQRIDGWSDRIQVSVNFPLIPEDVADRRKARQRSHTALETLWQKWAEEKTKKFEDWYSEERHGYAQVLISLYQDYQKLLYGTVVGGRQFSEDVWNPRVEVDIVRGLLMRIKETGRSEEEAWEFLLGFLNSEATMNAPANDLSAMLLAALARRASLGQKRVPTAGTWTDISTISAYLPYCDAMFVDDEFATILRENPVKDRLRWSTGVFSNRSKDEFLEYLRQIERDTPSEHIDLVRAVYGPTWEVPFRDILKHERERRSETE